MAAVLWMTVLGLGLLLLLGAVLALFAAGLPLVLNRWEVRPAARSLELPGLGLAGPGSEAVGTVLPSVAVQEPASGLAESMEEEPLVAAAIALALARYQQEDAQRVGEGVPGPGCSSPWALSGRWQAMQARVHLTKR